MAQKSLMDRLNSMKQDASVGEPPPVDSKAEQEQEATQASIKEVISVVHLQSKSPAYGGFFGNTTRRFQFRNYRLQTTREDADFILKHHASFVHEVPDPNEV